MGARPLLARGPAWALIRLGFSSTNTRHHGTEFQKAQIEDRGASDIHKIGYHIVARRENRQTAGYGNLHTIQ